MSADLKVELETRTCAGGCGNTFRCLPGSPTVYARANCEHFCQGKLYRPEERKDAFRGKSQVVHDAHARVWSLCVKEAKMCVARMQIERLKIADLALKACTIPKPGAERAHAHAQGVYTLTRFAEDIGVKPATLRRWVSVKTNVVDKLDIDVEDFPAKDYHAAERTMIVLKAEGLKDPVKVKERFVKEKTDIAEGRKVDHSLRRFINLAQFLERRALELKPTPESKGELQEFAEALDAALSAVRKVLKQC